jgi:predicted XRE-type DNA-binding protein
MPDEESEKLINDLKQWATDNDVSQADIARLLGVDRQRVSDWFSTDKSPTLESGLKIQRLLKGKRRKKK